jgi:hypothetical protein
MISKKDYLKNYSDIAICCTAKINGKKYDAGRMLDVFNRDEFMKKAQDLCEAVEKTILHENGYYEDYQKAVKQ